MSGAEREEQIKKLYEREKRGRIRGVVITVLIFFVMMAAVSLFLGNPFPHKVHKVLFEATESGWVTAHGYLLIICAVVGVLAGIADTVYRLLTELKRFDSILLQDCDVSAYLETMTFFVSYGRTLKFTGFQKTCFSLAQQKYVQALIAGGKYEEADTYLREEWRGEKDNGMYRKTRTNLKLAQCYQKKDAEGFREFFDEADAVFQKNPILTAEKYMLESQFQKAAKLLENGRERFPYNEVIRQYLSGVCYERLGETKKAQFCMQYAAEHGNTMPVSKKARQWLVSGNEEHGYE